MEVIQAVETPKMRKSKYLHVARIREKYKSHQLRRLRLQTESDWEPFRVHVMVKNGLEVTHQSTVQQRKEISFYIQPVWHIGGTNPI